MSLIETVLKKGGLAPLPKRSIPVATATLATSATLDHGNKGSVASVASVAVANPTADSTHRWEQWQAANPSPGNVSMTEDKTSDLRVWLELIGEHDKATIDDVLRTCERFPETRARCLREARTTEARQIIATRAALEAAEEHAALLSEDRTRSEAERVAKLAELFYNHLFGPGMATGCCWASRDRYCSEGERLRDIYYEAAKAAGRLL